MQTRRTKETTSLKARKFWTRERLPTPPERRETTSGTAMVARFEGTMMESDEEEDADVAVEVQEVVEAEGVPEVAAGRESSTGSPGTAGPGSRPRRRGAEEERGTGATLRMT